MRHLIFALALCATPALTPAQDRVFISGLPTNVSVDFSNVLWSSDVTAPDAFFALMPISELYGFAVFDPGEAMDIVYGAGNWLRCRMEATEWGYNTTSACAHRAPSGSTVAGPMSLLTSTYDFGPYDGVVGSAHWPAPNWTRFPGNRHSFVEGLGESFTREHWQLRTRGFQLSEVWNDCTPASLTPTFQGWIAIRFEVTFR